MRNLSILLGGPIFTFKIRFYCTMLIIKLENFNIIRLQTTVRILLLSINHLRLKTIKGPLLRHRQYQQLQNTITIILTQYVLLTIFYYSTNFIHTQSFTKAANTKKKSIWSTFKNFIQHNLPNSFVT